MPLPKWLPAAAGAGATVLGSVMQGKAANKNSDRQWELLAEEMKRRNQMQAMLAPSTLHALGYRNPSDIEQATSVIRGTPSPMSAGAPPPGPQGSTAGKVLGAASTGLGVAGAIGSAVSKPAIAGGFLPVFGGGKAASVLGALGGPVGMGIAGAGALTALAANKSGQGRRTANKMTQGGPQEQFEAEMGQARTAAELDAAYQKFMSSLNQWKAAGGNQAKVAEQALNKTPVLWQTYNQRRSELGGR